MARSRGRNLQARNRVMPPLVSLRTIVYATGIFFGLILFFYIPTLKFSNNSSKNKKDCSSNNNANNKNNLSIFDSPDSIPTTILKQLDAVLVLGGGRPISLYEPQLYTKQRCDDTAAVIKRRQQLSKKGEKNTALLPILCLSGGTGTIHSPQSNDGSSSILVSISSAAYFEKEHKLINNIYVETTSYDTIGNAFFARTTHTDITGWRNLLIVTNKFHMKRTKIIFDWIFGLKGDSYKLHYLESADVGLSADELQAREEKEVKSIVIVQQYVKKYRTLRQVWKYLNHEHDLYTTNKIIQRGAAKMNDEIINSDNRSEF